MTKKSLEKLLETITKDTDNGYVIRDGYFVIYMGTISEDVEDEFNYDSKTTKKEILDEIYDRCNSYDVDEHFNLWWGANRGEPSSARELLRHCDYLGDNYEVLQQKCIEELRKL